MYGSNVDEYIADSGWKVKGRNVKGQIVKEKRKDTGRKVRRVECYTLKGYRTVEGSRMFQWRDYTAEVYRAKNYKQNTTGRKITGLK
jgi:limonene-1,2-epoxide hydrolase